MWFAEEGSGSDGSITSRKGVNRLTGGMEYGVVGRAKCRDSDARAASGARSNVVAQPSGGVTGSTRCSASSGKGMSISEEKGLVEDNVSS